MTSVDFVFSPEATARFFDVILCLARFSESVGIEARRGKVGEARCISMFWFLIWVPASSQRTQLFKDCSRCLCL